MTNPPPEDPSAESRSQVNASLREHFQNHVVPVWLEAVLGVAAVGASAVAAKKISDVRTARRSAAAPAVESEEDPVPAVIRGRMVLKKPQPKPSKG
jgi:hypothetical protein